MVHSFVDYLPVPLGVASWRLRDGYANAQAEATINAGPTIRKMATIHSNWVKKSEFEQGGIDASPEDGQAL